MREVELNFYIGVLMEEIEVLRSRIQPHDCGHLYTTIHTLESRIEELEKELSALSSAG